VQPNEQIVLDWFDHLSETDRSVAFDDKMNAYLAKHPSVANPTNAGK